MQRQNGIINTSKRKSWNSFFLFLVWIFSLHLLGIYLFSYGFFLTRYEVEQKSECSILPDGTIEDNKDFCWQEQTFNKVVILVIDALRYDYLVWNETSHKLNISKPNENKLPIINYLLNNEPSHTFLFNGIADPPSVTMQRIKGITTGGLPTFIDIRRNFDSNAILEVKISNFFFFN